MNEELNVFDVAYELRVAGKTLEEIHPLILPEELRLINDRLITIRNILLLDDKETLKERAIYTIAKRDRGVWRGLRVNIDPIPERLQELIYGKKDKELE